MWFFAFFIFKLIYWIRKMFPGFVIVKNSPLCSGICAKESKTLERVVLVIRVCASATLSTFASLLNPLAVDTWSRSSEYLPPRIRRRARLMFLPSAWRKLLTFFIRYLICEFITKTLRASLKLCHLWWYQRRLPPQFIMRHHPCTKILLLQ